MNSPLAVGVTPLRYVGDMSRKIWKAAEIEKMTPAEQDRLFEASIVSDFDEVPAEFLERVRARASERINELESLKPS